MSFLTSTLTTVVLSIFAISFTALAFWLSIKAIWVGIGITRFIIALWIIAGVLWSIIGFKVIWNYILEDRMAQFVIIVIIWIFILFVPSQKNSSKKIRRKSK